MDSDVLVQMQHQNPGTSMGTPSTFDRLEELPKQVVIEQHHSVESAASEELALSSSHREHHTSSLEDTATTNTTVSTVSNHSHSSLQHSPPRQLQQQEEQVPPEQWDEWHILQQEGQGHEQGGDLARALQCYEKVLMDQSRVLGPDSVVVAQSLVHVGRIFEEQGNAQGSLDLYRAAHAIYATQVLSDSFVLQDASDAERVLQLVPVLLNQERYDDGIVLLHKCLESLSRYDSDDSSGDNDSLSATSRGKLLAQLHVYLGRAYLGLRKYCAATVCLVEAAQYNGDEQEILDLLQRVEFCQRQDGSEDGGSSSRQEEDLDSVESEVHVSSLVSESMVMTSHDENDDSGGYEADAAVDTSSSRRLSLSDESSTCFGSDLFTTDNEQETVDPLGSDFLTTTTDNDDDPHHPPLPIDHVPHEDLKFEQDEQGSRLLRADPQDPGPRRLLELPMPLKQHPVDTSTRTSSNSSRASSNRSDPENPKRRRRIPSPRLTKTLKEQFRRTRRGGFESLPEEEEGLLDDDENDSRALSPVLLLEQEYHTSFDGPVEYIEARRSRTDDEMSEITFVVRDDADSSRESGSEWWWGVTAEGFGRWFPTHIVSPAVEAAEGFLSAKAIHSQAKKKPLDFDSEDEESTTEEEEGALDKGDESVELKDYSSHLGVASQRKSVNIVVSSSRDFEYKIRVQPSPRLSTSLAPQAQSSPRIRSDRDLESEIMDLEKVIARLRAAPSNSHAELADSLFTLAVFRSRKGSAEEAVVSAQEALRIQKATANMNDATRSLHFLADLHLHQKQYKASLTFYSESLRIEKNTFGYYSEEVAKTLNCIGTVRSLQKEFGLAMKSHQEALEILKEVHGENLKHPFVSETLCQIGSVYYRERNSLSTIQAKADDYSTFIETGMLEVIGRAHEDRGSYKMAIAFFEEKLQFLKNCGKEMESPEDIAATLNSLGMLSARAGLFVEALEYYDGALKIQMEIGCDKVYLATAQVLTAAVQFQMGDWQKALQKLQEALEALHDELGDDHETVAATLYQIGLVHSSLCNYDEAMSALDDALAIQTLLLGEEHPATLRTRRQIGNLYAVYEAELETAFEEFNEILAAQKRIHSERHPNVAETLHSIGCAQARNGDMTNALRTLEECYYMRVEFLGWDHPLQATTLHEIALIHLKARRLKRALHICDNVLGICTESLGETHVDVAKIMTTKGRCYIARGDFAEATKCFDEALPMAEEGGGKSHPAVADIYVQIGLMNLRKCQFEEASEATEKALGMYRDANFDEDHPGIREAVSQLERIEREEMLFV